MSNIDSLLDAVRAAYARLAEVEAVAAAHPGDRFVLTSVQSLKAHAQQLEAEWLEECRVNQVEVCRYRLIATAGRYLATAFTKSLLEFQELFSQIFDAKRYGAKRRAIVSGEVLSETMFDFAFSYPGSLGVVLTMQDDPGLFGSKFTEAIQALHQITGIEDEHDVRDAANVLGDAVIKKVFDWSSVNYLAGYNVDITWSGLGGELSGQLVDRLALGRMIELIERTSDVERQTFRVIGTLVAIDVRRKRFRLVVPEGDDYAGPLADEFDLTREWAVNRTYAAQITVEAVTRYATQRTMQTYRLDNLQDEQSSLTISI